jgi:hypothetical protein
VWLEIVRKIGYVNRSSGQLQTTLSGGLASVECVESHVLAIDARCKHTHTLEIVGAKKEKNVFHCRATVRFGVAPKNRHRLWNGSTE